MFGDLAVMLADGGGARPRLVEVDLDATLLVALCDRRGAAGNLYGRVRV